MTRSQILSPVFVAVLLAIGCGSSAKPQDAAATGAGASVDQPLQLAELIAGSQPAAAAGSASVRGTIHLSGTAPAQAKVKMDADPICKQQHTNPVYTEEVVANNGGLQYVFVYVKEGVRGSYPAPTTSVVLEQAGCWYVPHVFGIQVGQPLEIVNSDATLHNVNVKPTVNQPFNIAQPVKGMKMTKKFTKTEIGVKFKCNVHPWMSAYAGVVEHPFFSVSGADGSFAITGLPAGTYTLEAWHEKYGTQTQTVTVGSGERKSIELTFQAQ